MSKTCRATSLLSALTLTLIGNYMAIDVLFFARQGGGWLSMTAGLPMGSRRPNRRSPPGGARR